ncbi:MAG: AAA family ATPase [Caldilineaceae bacterium]
MAHLELFLLGAPRVVLDGAPITFDTRKAVALLAFLAVTGQPQQRDALAALLWPDADQPHARGALRRTLSVLHVSLGRTPLLRIEREQVGLCLAPTPVLQTTGWNPRENGSGPREGGTGAYCDARAFLDLARGCAQHAAMGGQAHLCVACREHFERAASLYQDHFMAGFSLRDSASYDDWQFFQGEDLRRTLTQVLETLAACHTARHTWEQAIDYARRRLALDTLHEPAHRQLMLLYAWSNQRAAALRQYQECQRILEAELGVPPLAETAQLYDAILNHRPPPPPSPSGIQETTEPDTALSTAVPAIPIAPPLIGRDSQWEALLAAYRGAGTRGHLVVIEGEEGAGKTKLGQTFAAHVRSLGAVAACGICYAGEETLAFAPVEQLLRQILEEPGVRGRLTGIDPTWRQALQRLLPELPADPANRAVPDVPGSQSHFLEGLTRSLADLLNSSQPGLLLLDDLQFADNATLDLLAYMVRRLQGVPLLLVATWASGYVPPNHRLRQMAAEAARRQTATLLTLPPLDEAAIAELLAEGDAGKLRTGTSRARLAQRLHAETHGLPLFVVEYLDLLQTGALDPQAGEWPAPQGVRQFLHERLAGLSETAQQVISTAAVIGHSFDTETVVAASGRSEDEAVGALEELLARRLILEQGMHSFDFAHAQLPGIVYDEISQVRRRLLHRRVAEGLAAGARRSRAGLIGAAAALAYHYELGGVLEKAAHWAVTAAEHARQVYANREAVRYYEKALALGAENVCAIRLHLGDLHTLQGEYSQALDSYRLARQACLAAGSDINAEGEIEHRLGRLHHRLGEAAQAVCHYAAALDHLPPDAAHSRALVLVDWSLTAYGMAQLDEGVRLAQEALEQAQGGGGQAVPARAYDILSLVARKRNDLPAAIAYGERSLAAARELNDPPAEMAALNSLALAHAANADTLEAVELVNAALALCIRLGDRHREAALRNNLADLYHASGQPDEAMQQLKQAVAIFAEVGAEAGPENAEIWMLSEW